MIDLCIIGSGLSGSFLADKISRKLDIEIYDKARGVGGRTSNRRFKNYSLTMALTNLQLKQKNLNLFCCHLRIRGY